mgnify:CR=1 FL=1
MSSYYLQIKPITAFFKGSMSHHGCARFPLNAFEQYDRCNLTHPK